MGLINRLLLFIYAGVALLITLFVIAFATKALPEDMVFNEIRFLMHQSETITVLGVIAAFSAYFLIYAFFVGEKKKPAPKETGIVIKTSAGEVKIARAAIEALVNKEAMSVSGVRESAAKVVANNNEGEAKLSLSLSLVLLAGANVPSVSEQVANAVKNRIFESLGEQNVPVNLSVRELNSSPSENQKRVH